MRDIFASNGTNSHNIYTHHYATHTTMLHTPLCYTHHYAQQLAAAAIKQCTDSLINTAENALLQSEDDPYALMQSPVASMGQFRPCLGRQDSEIIRIQEDMERTGKVLTKIQLEWI